MITLFAPPGARAIGEVVELDDEESRHVQVRRATEGDAAVALDGEGAVIHGVLVKGEKRWGIRMTAVEQRAAHPPTIIAVAAGDRDRFLWIAEKAAELNVTRIIPLQCDRQRNVENRLRDVGVDRARRRAREACKQSGNPWVPQVDDVTSLRDLAPDASWLLADAGGSACPSFTRDAPVGWIIGPEGGFTADEARFCTSSLGALPVSFGATILRFETAAVAAAVVTLDRRSGAS